MSSHLERPALGQKVVLGTFYNAHNDTFLPTSLFCKELPDDAVRTSQRQDTSTALSYVDSFKARLDLLGVSPELGSSILSGLSAAGGSGRCIFDEPQVLENISVGKYYGAFHHRTTTGEDLLQLDNSVLKRHITPQVLQHSQFTHVVGKIAWGCQTVVVTRYIYPTKDGDEVSQQGIFSGAMETLKNAVDELLYMPDRSIQNAELAGGSLSVAAYSEVFDDGGIIMQDLNEAFSLIKIIPSLLRYNSKNPGKGEPISYTLLPIKIVAEILGINRTSEMESPTGLLSHASGDLDAVLGQFAELEAVWKRLVVSGRFLSRYTPYVSRRYARKVETTIEHVKKETGKLKETYARHLEQWRMCGLDEAAIIELREKIVTLESQCTTLLDVIGIHCAKFVFADKAVSDGAIYCGYNGVNSKSVLNASAASKLETYVFKFSQEAMLGDKAIWDAHKTLLDELLEDNKTKRGESTVLVVDCDAFQQPLGSVSISYYRKDGKCVTDDLYEQKRFKADNSFAYWVPGKIESLDTMKKPVQRRKVKIACPNANCDNQRPCEWICSRCGSQLEFGYTDEYFYCECGRAKFDDWKFKCNGKNHSKTGKKEDVSSVENLDAYMSYDDKTKLLSALKNLEQSDYVNILILGETGVGKSTFINALLNYLSFETLEEAKRAESLNWLIPCAFSIQSIDRSQPNGAIKESKIVVGERDDENDGSSGASATQQTAVYVVNIGTKTIRLFDTPGIGDTRGLDYDKKNMADILKTLNGYDVLHGILILLKSNNSRLTVMFNFCMQELLTHLHRSASKNMAFGFTNTRISNYSPGDTFGPLSSLLKKHKKIGLALENQNTFCFDSESFRFLAAFKKGITMDNEEDFQRSWDHSREEAMRLVKYFESKKPHQIKSTISLNGTRQLISEFTKPMANITQIINTNIKIYHDQMQDLGSTQLTGKSLRKRLQVQKAHLRAIKLDRPRTVCHNKDCVEWRDDGTGTLKSIYKNPCHNPCYLDNVEVDRVNCPELMRCRAFHNRNGFCRHKECGHSWQEHLHVYYELEEYMVMVMDTEAQRLFQQNESDIVVKRKAIEECKVTIEEFRKEHERIQEAAARFGVFLKQHSITPYNDATLEYLDMLIDEEEMKARISRDKTKLDALKRDRASHIELVQTIEKSMAGSDNAIGMLDVAGVEVIVRELYSLKHFGQELQNLKNSIITAHQATYRERPHKVQGRSSAASHSQRKKATSGPHDDRRDDLHRILKYFNPWRMPAYLWKR